MENLATDIGGISDAHDLKDLAARVQKVLFTMAYYISQSEGAVLELHEGWHDGFADALYEAAGAARGEKSTERRSGPREAREDSLLAGAKSADERRTARSGHRKAVQKTEHGRPKAGNVPSSLLAIMNGTHPSFREDDTN